jgi:hypothetical protein
MKRLSAVALIAALPLLAWAQTYKWVDEKGQVHYTQVPPRSGKYQTIQPAQPPAAAPNQDALNQSLQDTVRKGPEQQKAAEQAAAKQAQRQEACRKALEQVAYMDARTARRLGTKDESGNTARMSEEEFARQRAAWQEQAAKNCE